MNQELDPIPTQDVRFIELKTESWENANRFKVFVKVTEFLYPPSYNFFLKDQDGLVVSELTLIENSDAEFVFTMHLRRNPTSLPLELTGEIFYPDDLGTVETKVIVVDGL